MFFLINWWDFIFYYLAPFLVRGVILTSICAVSGFEAHMPSQEEVAIIYLFSSWIFELQIHRNQMSSK